MNKAGVGIQFVDYGNYADVPLNDLVAMDARFLQLPVQCLRCALQGVSTSGGKQWTQQDVERFCTVSDDTQQVFFGAYNEAAECFLVEMYGTYMIKGLVLNINEAFGKHSGKLSPTYKAQGPPPATTGSDPPPGSSEAALKARKKVLSSVPNSAVVKPNAVAAENRRPSPQIREDDGASKRSFAHEKISIGTGVQPSRPIAAEARTEQTHEITIANAEIKSGDAVYISFADSPSNFWCQPAVSSERLSSLVEQINADYEKLRASSELSLKSPKVGQVCCALYPEDQSWYRGRILHVQGQSAEVYFVDFGNRDKVAVNTLKQLRHQYLSLPSQAVECCLAGILPKDGTWSSEANAKFAELYDDKELQVKIVEKIDDQYSVELCEFGVRSSNFGQALTRAGFAVPSLGPSLGTFPSQDSIGSSSGGNQPPSRSPLKFNTITLAVGSTVDVNVVHSENP